MGTTRRRASWWLALALALGLALAGCTYSRVEPGLFGPRPSEAPVTPSRPPVDPPNPELPVAAEREWTSAEGLSVTSRFAVHAVRRMAGATVLDWSVTPLSAPGLTVGDDVSSLVDLGLARDGGGDVNVVLLDDRNRVYRPLSHWERSEFNHCLCSPMWVAQLSLRLGETRLLQVAFPALPEDVRFIDVALANSLPFRHVPVTGVGQVPTARRPVDLTRPVPARVKPATTVFPTYPPSRQRLQGIQINEVVRSPAWTAIHWTLTSLTEQPSVIVLPPGPPISTDPPPGVLLSGTGTASGPQLRRAGDAPLHARFATSPDRGQGTLECLCSDLGVWAAGLRDPGGTVSLATTYPPVPAGTSAVEIVLPTVGTVPGVPVVEAPDLARSLGPPVERRSATWTYRLDDPPSGWPASAWPTPLPSLRRIQDYRVSIESVVTVPGW